MSTTPARPLEETPPHLTPGETIRARGLVAWSGFFFAVLQSVCTFLAVANGLRLAIGLGSLAASSVLDRLHADWVRVPMIGLALAGSVLNLVVLWQVRRLRARPASQWRQRPVSEHKLRMERVQMILSVATLALITVEEYFHFQQCHHL